MLPGSLFVVPELIPEPPAGLVEKARAAVAAASSKKAGTLSAKQYREAKMYYDSAIYYWKSQNERWIFLRDYSLVEDCARRSINAAGIAGKIAGEKYSALSILLPEKIKFLNEETEKFRHIFRRLPLSRSQFESFSKGLIRLSEAENALAKNDLTKANALFNEAEKLIRGPLDFSNQLLDDYFSHYETWKKLADNAIRDSRKNKSSLILVDKFARECHLYQGGVLKTSFEIELGTNWIGDKSQRGDLATPEGRYKITEKLRGRQTKYYKALMLNYPNEEDIRRFEEAKRLGRISRDAHIGGLIEIHGDGGKGADWTEGCVALTNQDMDRLYSVASVGTPVVIVGSLKSFDEVKKEWQ